MKILIVHNMQPFIWGGAEELAVNLQKNLVLFGHQSEILRIPFQWEPCQLIPSQMLMVRAFELDNVDRVIALKFPAYLIRHHHKTLWLLHQYRQAYDLYDSGMSSLVGNTLGESIKEVIKNADNQSFTESKKIFTNSKVTQDRLAKYNGFEAKVLLPPVNDFELFANNNHNVENYIFAGGRINSMKRQHLLVEALKFTNKNVRLLIAGPPEDDLYVRKIQELIIKYDLNDRIKLDFRFLPRGTYAKYIHKSLAVAYLPFDEDSFGYVAMEGAAASKALITTKDSGGILGLVKHEETGWVANASAKSLAESMNEVYRNSNVTRKYGLAAKNLLLSLKITWPHTIERLL